MLIIILTYYYKKYQTIFIIKGGKTQIRNNKTKHKTKHKTKIKNTKIKNTIKFINN